ncbi:MAG: type IX secretion system membrane protein PorP/SprF [Sporocytophaga sp.]|uniref:type IX secretion system membrane protein PorP/SprF n=1 Tax=Sporocytophaga sp. TaxID=2231183 RepID=UPI001B2D37AC|nr:type IX secretion system membrane protein PorP/SprF [Sporocytophaga sp.]MBO9703610.1 type IX secretion system membrane protein PorP/SprF [Sporocytophaga sp.]
MCKPLRYSKYIMFGIAVMILLQSNSSECFAQLNATVFEDFSQFIVNPYLINPSATDSSYSFKICANNINELGLIKNVSRFYIDGDKRINSSRKNGFHFIGLQAINSKQGDYISRSRMQAHYSWFAQVSKKAFLSSGVSLGFINYAFLTTQGGTGGSDYAPDGSIGIHYVRPNTFIGLAIQQVFTSVLIPVNQSFRLSRLYNLDLSHHFDVGPRTNLAVYGMVQQPDKGNTIYSLGLLSEISNVVLVGVNDFSLRKTSFNLGVKQIRLLGAEFMFMTTYSIYHGSFPLPDNSLELFIVLQK